MDDDFQLLEAELKRLRPIAPSREVHERVAGELQAGRRSRFSGWAWVALPAAAAIALACVLGLRQTPVVPEKPATSVASAPSVSSTAAFKPVHAENVLLDARDEGYVTLTDGTPARRVRQSYVDRITWKNPDTNASLVWSVPREEVRVVPVNFQ